ncbi:hypothetical protein ACLOJK_003383 [Asimina triloba]
MVNSFVDCVTDDGEVFMLGGSHHGMLGNSEQTSHERQPSIQSVLHLLAPHMAHAPQLDAFSLVFQRLEEGLPRLKLQLVGSCQNREDQERLENLKAKCIKLNIRDDAEFHETHITSRGNPPGRLHWTVWLWRWLALRQDPLRVASMQMGRSSWLP